MGCGASVPDVILLPPGDQPCAFLVKKPMMSSGYQVFTGDGEKKKWLHIVNKSSWFESHNEFELKSYADDLLVKATIKGTDYDLKRKVDWEADSDDSDFSNDGLFDWDDDLELKVKLKWKVKREAVFTDTDGKQFAKLSVKVKGKSKAELEIENREGEERETMNSSTKVKKVFYKLEWEGNAVDPTFENGHWQDWDRSWKCDMFDATYDAKMGVDEVHVQTKGNCLGGDALSVAFAMAYFFHPAAYAEQMDSQVRQDARAIMGRLE